MDGDSILGECQYCGAIFDGSNCPSCQGGESDDVYWEATVNYYRECTL